MRRRSLLVLLVSALAAATCGTTPAATTATTPPSPATSQLPAPATTAPAFDALPVFPVEQGEVDLRLTHHRRDGNRFVLGRGSLDSARPIDVEVGGTPRWVLGTATTGGVLWVTAIDDGSLVAFATSNTRAVEVQPPDASLLPGQPFALAVDDAGITIVASAEGESPFSHPVILRDGTRLAIGSEGALLISNGPAQRSAAVDALLDSRLAVSASGRVAVLSEPTDRYPHGILGDPFEAASLAVVDLETADVVATITVAASDVIESLAPMWVGGAAERVLATVSNPAGGAGLVLFDQVGGPPVSGPDIGTGNRWRHQIATGPIGPNREFEIVAVRTPHIGGVVEFYSLDSLEIVARQGGFTSHQIFSRNLDLALVADADGDGAYEVVIPTQSRDSLGAVRRTADGAEVAWEVPIGGQISSNLAAVTTPDGSIWFAAGTEEGEVRVWPGE